MERLAGVRYISNQATLTPRGPGLFLDDSTLLIDDT
jgi:hypothetical protein